MKYLKRLKSESEYNTFLGGGEYIEPHIVTIEEVTKVFFKSVESKKKINTVRIATPSGSGTFKTMVSSDGSGNPPYFEYPVTSDIYFEFNVGTGQQLFCQIGNVSPSTIQYWPPGGNLITNWTPKEDDTYIYQVIVE